MPIIGRLSTPPHQCNPFSEATSAPLGTVWQCPQCGDFRLRRSVNTQYHGEHTVWMRPTWWQRWKINKLTREDAARVERGHQTVANSVRPARSAMPPLPPPPNMSANERLAVLLDGQPSPEPTLRVHRD